MHETVSSMRGPKVIVRCYGGRPAIRRVWAHDSRKVFLADDEQYSRLESGLLRGFPLGFPRDDVFEYDERVARQVLEGSNDPVQWDGMRLLVSGR